MDRERTRHVRLRHELWLHYAIAYLFQVRTFYASAHAVKSWGVTRTDFHFHF